MTIESFQVWKTKFDRGLAIKKSREDEEKMKSLTAKEREEWKRAGSRLSGIYSFFYINSVGPNSST